MTDNKSILIKLASSMSCNSKAVQIVPSGARINPVELVKGSSTKTTPPACKPEPLIKPSILEATCQTSG